ncbi:MAG: inositol monophosphatase family protein [Anaerolineales bacterium]
MTATLQWTIDLARAAGARLQDWFGNVTAERKSDGTLVTQADMDVDRFLAEQIRRAYPADDIVSEELNTTYAGQGRAVWVFDPLDGTTNFRNGLPIWGVSIARIVEGLPELGVCFFPVLGMLFSAVRGGGAYLNGDRLHTSAATSLQPNDFFVCCAHTLRRYNIRVGGKTRVLGSAVYDLAAAASGRALIVALARPKIWDLAAGWLLVREAGGAIQTMDGENPFPLTPGHDYVSTSFPIVAAATEELLATARARIRPKPPADGGHAKTAGV